VEPKSLRNIVISILLAIGLLAGGWYLTRQVNQRDSYQFSMVTELEIDGNAEILAATADGKTLLHSNTKRNSIDLIDISNPARASFIRRVITPGEPTSVAISPDDKWAIATVYLAADQDEPLYPGALAIIDITEPSEARMTGMIGVGHQPDSLSVTKSGASLYAILAIENEPMLRAGEEGETDVSLPGMVQIVSFNPERPGNYRVGTLDLSPARLERAGMQMIEDPQPEFIAISRDQTVAAASLQENNGIVVFDPYTLDIRATFNVGKVADRPADLTNDNTINFAERYPRDAEPMGPAGLREPDGIAFTPDGKFIVSADEGEAELSGGRGVSLWTIEGEFVWDDGGEIERTAADMGYYDDGRSSIRGIEIEGVSTASFGGQDYFFALAERGAFMVIYALNRNAAPTLVQILATETEPEHLIAIPARGLIAVGSEDAGSLRVYRHNATSAP